jgi:hypothetical protein
MAAPFPTTYYLAIGTAISNLGAFTELSGGSYARLACAFTGTAVSGLTQTVGPWVVATAPTPAVPCTYGAIFDSLTGGNMLAYWNWTPPAAGLTGSLTAFPSTIINLTFNQYISTALNLALQGGQGTSGSLVDAGAQIGLVNGQPMVAGCRLTLGAGGTLTAHLGSGQWIGSADVQGNLYSGAFGSGNMNLGVTALAGGASSSSTPMLSGFYNRIAVAATANDSVILPTPANYPGAPGTWLLVSNGGANAIKVFPDSPAVINSAATSLVVTAGASCTFFRENAGQWRSIPTIPV